MSVTLHVITIKCQTRKVSDNFATYKISTHKSYKKFVNQLLNGKSRPGGRPLKAKRGRNGVRQSETHYRLRPSSSRT